MAPKEQRRPPSKSEEKPKSDKVKPEIKDRKLWTPQDKPIKIQSRPKTAEKPESKKILARTKPSESSENLSLPVETKVEEITAIETLFPVKPKKLSHLKLVDENMNFNTLNLSKFMTDHGPPLVIGVLGRMGTGKSTLVQSLSGGAHTSNRSHTVGIDLYITPLERVLILDTCPFTPLDRPKHHTDNYRKSHTWQQLSSIKAALFLFSVCDVVLVVSDSSKDLDLWYTLAKVDLLKARYLESMTRPTRKPPTSSLEKIESEKGSIQSISEKKEASSEKLDLKPNLVLVYNKAKPENFTLAGFQALASTFLENNLTTMNITSLFTQPLYPQSFPTVPNILMIPPLDDLDTLPLKSATCSLNDLVQRILQVPRMNIQSTEKSWQRLCSQIWTKIQSIEIESALNHLKRAEGQ